MCLSLHTCLKVQKNKSWMVISYHKILTMLNSKKWTVILHLPLTKPLKCQISSAAGVRATRRKESESESELSLDHRSLDLASSHSSDEDDTTTHNGTLRVNERRTNPPPGGVPMHHNHLCFPEPIMHKLL